MLFRSIYVYLRYILEHIVDIRLYVCLIDFKQATMDEILENVTLLHLALIENYILSFCFIDFYNNKVY